MLLEEIARTSIDVAATSARLGKVARIAETLGRLSKDEVRIAVSYLSGELPQGTIGVGWASLRELPPSAAPPPALELLEVDSAVSRIAAVTGPGSQAARRRELDALLTRATEPEQRFLVALLLGELRQGALEGVVTDAVAKASGVPAATVRRAAMLSGSLADAAESAFAGGSDGLSRFRLVPLRPVKPMLARSADGVEEALERIGPALLEWKLDGARIQVHRLGGEVRAYTRNLADISDRVPEIVDQVLALGLEAIVLDGEAIALRPDGRPYPFQVTMSRFGSASADASERRELPLTPFFFDCLHLDGDDLLDRPARERSAALAKAVPAELRVPSLETDALADAHRFLEEALAHGHEGVMVKALDAPYLAGRRGAGWLKVKRAQTLDLVVLAAEWGHGRRTGRLSNIHLGARDPESGGFLMLGKTFKGMTDEMLAWQTERLLELESRREGHVVFVRPELVVEVAFDGIQTSTRYPSGMALRFARVKGYRPDKPAREADTVATVRAIHEAAQ